ncbi:FGGY-family carbohydrate kinase [Cytobacillus sp. IB215665]|uniref:xylulokinase n=1 Tax=Cytobacillus sp. IB215665 TaxID=3097357 RepID=UPI002A0D5D68|nr:FGGY-family carbohydrate kinase [Cytobacillus sp. IB215665]MDX8367026.1 FGGY-family carbohydrate kinase [Cytobacillus sp. IB215665]
MGGKYLISHDVGTSSNKTVLVNTNGKIIASATASYPLLTPHPNWVEQQPEDYWNAIIKTTKQVLELASVSPQEVLGIIFTTQAMGIIPINSDGQVLRPNISWVDGRAELQAKRIMRKLLGEQLFKAVVGVKLMGKDVIPKLLWIKEKEPTVYHETKYFLDVNGFLKFKSTGNPVIEWSGASSYGFDLKKKDWLKFFFQLCGIDTNKLPPLVRSIDNVGGLTKEAADAMGLLQGTPVFGGCDDVQSAAVGANAVGEGEAHIYLGTSAWVCVSTSKNLKHKNGAAVIQSADPNMAHVVGITEAAGSCIQWIADQFYSHEQQDPNVDNIFDLMDEDVKKIPPGSDYLVCTPWMLGERCPVSTTTTRATLFNISLEHTREHMMRAVYEGVSYNLSWILENFKRDYGFDVSTLKLIGGGSLDSQWMQILSDVTQKPVTTVLQPQMAGAVGGAICAAIGLGIYDDFNCVNNLIKTDKHYEPNVQNAQIYSQLLSSYKSIYYSLKQSYADLNSARF